MTQTHDGFMGFMTQTSRGGEVRTIEHAIEYDHTLPRSTPRLAEADQPFEPAIRL